MLQYFLYLAATAGIDLKGSGSELAILRALWLRPGLLGFLCESHRTNLGCTYWMKAQYVLWVWALHCSIFWQNCVCMHSICNFGSFEIIFIIFNSKFTAKPEKKRNWKWFCVNAAVKVLPCRTSHPNVLWEDTWGTVWKLMMDIQIFYPLE